MKDAAQPPRLYVRVSDVPAVAGISTDTVYKAVKEGKLRIYRPVGVSLIKVAELEAWIEGRAA